MSDTNNPMLFGTEKDCAWNAWQDSYDGKADRAKFDAWWEAIIKEPGQFANTRELMLAAWAQGLQQRIDESGPGFDAWWQQIIDGQPVTK